MDLISSVCLEAVLGRTPTADEIKSAAQYIADNRGDHLITLVEELKDYLIDWRDENCFKCQACGVYYNYADKQTIDDESDDGEYYCENCICQARIDAKFDPHAEWGTGNRHTC